jgi:hypothetical protein
LDILGIINQSFKVLKKNLLWILPLSLLVGCINGYLVSKKPATYISHSKIFPLTAEGGGGDAMAGLRSQFGISSPGGDLSKYYNVKELVSSKHLTRQILSYPTNYKNEKSLVDWIIKDYNTQQFWNHNKIKPSQDSLENLITASGIFSGITNVIKEKTDFTSIDCGTANPELSLRLNECILQSLSDFYINSKTEKARTDLMRIGILKDSLKGALDYVERRMAGISDESRYSVTDIAKLPFIKLEMAKEELMEQYKNTAIAHQNANFKLLSESPIFQILDKPTTPLTIIKESAKKAFAKYFAIAFVLLTLFGFRKMIIDMVKEELKNASK